jgi:hypothetical protein
MPVISTIAAATARAFGAFKSLGGAADEFFNYVTLLLHGDGTNGAQNNTFLDSSTNNFTITRNGNTTQGTFSPFSQTGWSNYFGGGYLTAPNSIWTGLSSASAWTIEAWIYRTANAPNSRGKIIGMDGDNITNATTFGVTNSGALYIGDDGANNFTPVSTPTSTIAFNTWYHVVAVKSGTTVYLFVNGAVITSATRSTTNFPDVATLTIGNRGAQDTGFIGYISNLRVVNGTAVYTSAFTPPTAPLTAITNTSLLTCQSNRFRDASTNNFAITVNGDTSVQAFSPFAPTAAYSAATVGGSGYFDGSGDYLTAASNAAFALPSDFTWEAWVYRTTTSDDTIYSTNVNDGFIVHIISNKAVVRQFGVANLITSSADIATNTWTHIAVSRSGTTLSLWINGSRSNGGTATNSTSFAQGGLLIGINDISTNLLEGYLSNLRLVKGSAVYDPTQTTITVPTTPLTAITNTSLLLNFTNAGIIDNTAKNVLETVGNAQISTSVKKFGTGSLAFDGTGDYLLVPSTVNWDFGTGDFTVEFWINFTSVGQDTIIGKWGSGAGKYAWVIQVNSSNLIFYTGNNGTLGTQYTFSWSAGTSTWYHVAVTRSGSNLRAFVDGTQIGSTQSNSDSLTASGAFCCIGENLDGGGQSAFVTGYIDDLRITKRVARYTANFTAPTAAFADQ